MNTAKASTLLDGLLPHRGPTRNKTGRRLALCCATDLAEITTGHAHPPAAVYLPPGRPRNLRPMQEPAHHLPTDYDRLEGQITGPVADSIVISARSHTLVLLQQVGNAANRVPVEATAFPTGTPAGMVSS